MDRSELKLWYLKRLDLFKGMKEAEMKQIENKMVMKDYDKKEYIYFSLDDTDRVYFVKDGNVEIGYVDESGRELVLDILGPGEIFGTILGKGMHSGFARASGKALICTMNRTDFEDFLQRSPDVSLKVLKFLGFKINVLENKLQNLVFKDIKTRICDLLYSLYQKSGDKQKQIIKIPLTHQDIANLVGSTRETTSVYMSELKKDGIIAYERRRIKILSEEKLKEQISFSG